MTRPSFSSNRKVWGGLSGSLSGSSSAASIEMRRPRYSMMSEPLRIVREANTPRPWIGELRTAYARALRAELAEEVVRVLMGIECERGGFVLAQDCRTATHQPGTAPIRVSAIGVVTAASAVVTTIADATAPPSTSNWRAIRYTLAPTGNAASITTAEVSSGG